MSVSRVQPLHMLPPSGCGCLLKRCLGDSPCRLTEPLCKLNVQEERQPVTKVHVAAIGGVAHSAIMYSTFDQIEDDIRKSLAEAASNRSSPMHVPVVGTADGDVRMMVLRGFDRGGMTLRLHTDLRSPKVAAIARDDRVGLLFHDPAARNQIRVRGRATVLSEGPEVDAAWEQASAYARRCYLAKAAPGTPLDAPASGLPEEVEGVRPTEVQLVPARANFAVILVEVDEFDWLLLAHDGHRRARFAEGQWTWVVP